MPAQTPLSQRAMALERRFESILIDVHLPFLEVRLYRKYYINTQSEQRLADLEVVITAMQKHRIQTLRVLKLIHEREAVVSEVLKKAEEFSKSKSATLDVQTEVLRLLHSHQLVTRKVVDGIVQWRAGLTRPYPFHWNGVNYLRKILDDAAVIDESRLRTVLPLRLSLYPLCSNITSLSLFGGKTPKPPASGKPGAKTAEEKAQQAELRETEKVIFDEEDLQGRIMRELSSISASGYFVPLLNVQSVIPSCTTGIRISNRGWLRQLGDAIHDVADGAVASHAPHDDEHDDMSATDDDDGGHDSAIQTPARSSPRASTAPSSRASSVPPTPPDSPEALNDRHGDDADNDRPAKAATPPPQAPPEAGSDGRPPAFISVASCRGFAGDVYVTVHSDSGAELMRTPLVAGDMGMFFEKNTVRAAGACFKVQVFTRSDDVVGSTTLTRDDIPEKRTTVNLDINNESTSGKLTLIVSQGDDAVVKKSYSASSSANSTPVSTPSKTPSSTSGRTSPA